MRKASQLLPLKDPDAGALAVALGIAATLVAAADGLAAPPPPALAGGAVVHVTATMIVTTTTARWRSSCSLFHRLDCACLSSDPRATFGLRSLLPR